MVSRWLVGTVLLCCVVMAATQAPPPSAPSPSPSPSKKGSKKGSKSKGGGDRTGSSGSESGSSAPPPPPSHSGAPHPSPSPTMHSPTDPSSPPDNPSDCPNPTHPPPRTNGHHQLDLRVVADPGFQLPKSSQRVLHTKKPFLTIYLFVNDTITWDLSPGVAVAQLDGPNTCALKDIPPGNVFESDAVGMSALIPREQRIICSDKPCHPEPDAITTRRRFNHTFTEPGEFYFGNTGTDKPCHPRVFDRDHIKSTMSVVVRSPATDDANITAALDAMQLAFELYKNASRFGDRREVRDSRKRFKEANREYRRARRDRSEVLEGLLGLAESDVRCNVEGALNVVGEQLQADSQVSSSRSRDCRFQGDEYRAVKIAATRQRTFVVVDWQRHPVTEADYLPAVPIRSYQPDRNELRVTLIQGQRVEFQLGQEMGIVEVMSSTDCTPKPGGFAGGTNAGTGRISRGLSRSRRRLMFRHRFVEIGVYHFASQEHCEQGMRGTIVVVPAHVGGFRTDPEHDVDQAKFETTPSCSAISVHDTCVSALQNVSRACEQVGLLDLLTDKERAEFNLDDGRTWLCPRSCMAAASAAVSACGPASQTCRCSSEDESCAVQRQLLAQCYGQSEMGPRSWALVHTIENLAEQINTTNTSDTSLDNYTKALAAIEATGDVSSSCTSSFENHGSGPEPRLCLSDDNIDAAACCTPQEIGRLCALGNDLQANVLGMRVGEFRRLCTAGLTAELVATHSGLRVDCHACERLPGGTASQEARKQACLRGCNSQEEGQRRSRRDGEQSCREFHEMSDSRTRLFRELFLSDDCNGTPLPESFNAHDPGHPDYPEAWTWGNEDGEKCAHHQVRDQGSCSCCWAFTTTGVLSDRLCVQAPGVLDGPHLCEQELVSCTSEPPTGECTTEPCNWGCDGGYLETTILRVIAASSGNTHFGQCGAYNAEAASSVTCAGITQTIDSCDSDQGERRYDAEDNTCLYMPSYPVRFDPGATEGSFDVQFGCTSGTAGCIEPEQIIQAEIMTFGPIMAAVDVYEDLLGYTDGVFAVHSGDTVLGTHAVKVVGWGTQNGIPYWLCENQWSESWGLGGYIKIRRGSEHNGGMDDYMLTFDPVSGHDSNSFMVRARYTSDEETGQCKLTVNSTGADVFGGSNSEENAGVTDTDSSDGLGLGMVAAIAGCALALVLLVVAVSLFRKSRVDVVRLKSIQPQMSKRISGTSWDSVSV
eukprot:m.30878 g.30878  ORF g.30878 m.30878 type:complete len:1217 (+) comp9577_c0_seq1:375-4025(+)